MKTIAINNSIEQKYQALRSSKTPVNINTVPKEMDEYIMQKHTKRNQMLCSSLWLIFSIIPALKIEASVKKIKKTISNEKEMLEKITKLRKNHFAAPILMGMSLLFAYSEMQGHVKTGITPKWRIYNSQGIQTASNTQDSFYLSRYKNTQESK